jgi:hypothetical protein
MNLRYTFKHRPDILAIDCALRAINLPAFSGLSVFNNVLEIVFQDGFVLSQEQAAAVSAIVESLIDSCDWSFARRQRKPMLDEIDWRIQRALDEGEDATQLIEYRRALRDITKQESPDTVVWPTKPW